MNKLFTLLSAAMLTAAATVAAELPAHLYVIGDATHGGWDLNKSSEMVQTADGCFTYTGYISSDGSFKFLSTLSWDAATSYYAPEAGKDITDASSTLVNGGDDNQFKVTSSANYRIDCDLNAMTISVKKIDYQDNPIYYNVFYLIGSATPAIWTPADAIAMTPSATDYFTFSCTVTLKGDSQFKFLTNKAGGWDSQLYYRDATDAGKVSTDGTDDRNWSTPDAGAGVYTITVNLLANTIATELVEYAEQFTVYFDNSNNILPAPYVHYWGGESWTKWPGEAMLKVADNVYAYTLPAGTNCIIFSDNGSSQTNTLGAMPNHVYSYTTDEYGKDAGEYAAATADVYRNYPANVYVTGTLNGGSWKTSGSTAAADGGPIAATGTNGAYKWEGVVLVADSETDTNAYFTFITALSEDENQDTKWNNYVNAANRFGAPEADTEIADLAAEYHVLQFTGGDNASNANSWKVAPATYDIALDLAAMTLKLTKVGGLDGIVEVGYAADAPAEFFTLQGIRVASPTPGKVYIVRRGSNASKILFQ